MTGVRLPQTDHDQLALGAVTRLLELRDMFRDHHINYPNSTRHRTFFETCSKQAKDEADKLLLSIGTHAGSSAINQQMLSHAARLAFGLQVEASFAFVVASFAPLTWRTVEPNSPSLSRQASSLYP